MKPFLSVIIPAYNEEQRLPETLEVISQYLNKQQYNSEIIVVDDGSVDSTVTKVKAQKSKVKNLRILEHERNLGKGAAVKTGVMATTGKFILITDADNSTPIEETKKLFSSSLSSNSSNWVTIGSRHLKNSNVKIRQPWYRRLLSRAANKLIQLCLLPGITDTQCGFKLFPQKVAKKIFSKITVNRWGFDMEILFLAKKMNYEIFEVPITWLNSNQGRLRPIKAAIGTLKELTKIKLNDWRGIYSN